MRSYSTVRSVIQDNLFFEARYDDGTVIRQGKRIGKDNPLFPYPEARQAYIRKGLVAATAELRKKGLNLREARGLMNKARGRTRSWKR